MTADCRSLPYWRWNTRARHVTPVWRVKAWREPDQDGCSWKTMVARVVAGERKAETPDE